MTSLWGGGGLYEDWVSFLDGWGSGRRLDPAALPALRQEDFTGDSWERLAVRLFDALSRRLGLWADALTRGIGEARDEFGVARALADARSGLVTIRVLAAHEGLPAEFTGRLLEAVDNQIISVQRSLEEQVDRMRRNGAPRQAVEARLRTIRDNPLTAVTGEGYGGPARDPWYVDGSAPVRRRVVLPDPPGAR